MNQRLESTRFPYIPITISVNQLTTTFDALLDTGFDGEFILASGSAVYRPVFLGTATTGFLGKFPVEIAALGGEYLLGRGLSDRFAITRDHGRQIIVEP